MIYKEPAWAKYITEDNIEDENIKGLIPIIGFENVKKIMLNYSGIPILVSKSSFMKYKHQYVLDNYNGTKMSRIETAIACDMTENYIYKLMKKYKNNNKNIL